MATANFRFDANGNIIGRFALPQDGTQELDLTDPRVVAWEATLVPVKTITMLQFRRAVRASGKAAQVITAIQSLPADMQEAWQFAHRVPRNADFLLALQTALAVTDAQVDNFFTEAETFPNV